MFVIILCKKVCNIPVLDIGWEGWSKQSPANFAVREDGVYPNRVPIHIPTIS